MGQRGKKDFSWRAWGVYVVGGGRAPCKDSGAFTGRNENQSDTILLTSLQRVHYRKGQKSRKTEACLRLGPAGDSGGGDERWDLGSVGKGEPS